VRVWVLGSGSRGNAVVVESGACRVLIDVGFGPRVLKKRMHALGLAPESIEACIVTHEHLDHAGGAASAHRKWKWPLYASAGTIANSKLARVPVTPFRAGATLSFSALDIETFRTSHDAAEPVGVAITARDSGARAAIVTDLGMVTESVRRMVHEVDFLMIESNHDEDMLRAGPYPPSLQRRILSRVGHLSNAACADLVGDSVSSRLRTVVLAHLSEENNTPRLAFETMKDVVRRTKFRGLLGPAMQDAAVGPFRVTAGGASQLSLGL